ncbi:ABC transporter permease [Holzapfeliella sp. JNUCC 72]
MFKKKRNQEIKTSAGDLISVPPSGMKIVKNEIIKDKFALMSVFVLLIIVLFTFGGSLFVPKSSYLDASILDGLLPAFSPGHFLGTDDGGRDILSVLIVGGRNSILIGITVTVISRVIGIVLGLIAGYFGGLVDDIIMRIIDFIMVLPTGMIIIILTTMIPNYNAFTLVGLLSLFSWMGATRYFRSFILAQRQKEYVMASKTSGSSNLTIMFKEVLPNISSMIIINSVLGIAGNIGMETGLSFLGYGLPPTTPSIGTLVGYANNPINITNRPWLWLPAVVLLLVISYLINYVGSALQRAGDARQRR